MSLKAADKWFSKYIRARDADANGIVRCISCGDPHHWSKCDAGHFIKRQHMSLRFNEKNVNAQCRKCNWLEQGNDIGYAKGLMKKYGPGIIEYFEIARRQTHKLSKFELGVIAANYRQKFNEIKAEKGL